MARKKKMIAPKTESQKKAKVTTSVIGTIFRLLFTGILICGITGCIVVSAMVIYVMNFMEIDTDLNLDNVNLNSTTIFYAEDETEGMIEVFRMSGDERRIEVSLNQIPDYVIEAYVATEDKRFWEHEGVDWLRTVASGLRTIFTDETQGGSTITQQLIKNITLDNEVAPIRKLREIFRALELERNYSKDEILEAYLNIIFLGGQTYGVEAASQEYFGCHVWELTVPQAASLAGMTRSPNKRRPDLHPEENKERRDYALSCMLESGYITQAEYDEYVATPVTTVESDEETLEALANELKGGEENTETEDTVTTSDGSTVTVAEGISSYYVDAVIEEAIADLMEKYDWSRSFATQKLKNSGYRIYTCVDLELQQIVEEKYCDPSTFSNGELPTNEEGESPESAFVLMDYEGHLLAIVGGKGTKTESRSYNRATMAMRPPGSSMKPLSVYAPALEYDIINWSTVLVDSPAMTIDGKPWPNNYEMQYYGDTLIVDAIRYSRNTIPVKLMQQLTPERSVDYLMKKFGLTTLVTTGSVNDYTYSLAIGSMTDGVYLHELTAAYATFGNGGMYYEPATYYRIEDSNGNLIYDNTPKKTRAMSEETASIMNRLLWEVVNGGGTGREARLSNGVTVIGKTGTTQDYNDMMFVGLTPDYVAGIWTGYDTPAFLPYTQMNEPDEIFKIVMEDITAGSEAKDFTLSENIVRLTYCKITGNIATSACTQTGTGYYKSSAKPDTCDGNHYEGLDSDEDEEQTE